MPRFPLLSAPRGLLLFIPVAVLGFILDYVTKQWALTTLRHGDDVQWVIPDILGWQLRFNYGASFSFAQGATPFFALIGVVAVCAIPLFIARSRVWNCTLAIVWAGAAGNVCDRMRGESLGHGAVTDFIVYASWFTGNVADIFLVVGMAIIAVFLFRGFSPFEEVKQGV